MKKTLPILLMGLGLVCLTSCNFVKDIVNPEKQYNFENFKTLVADRSPSFDATKATGSATSNGQTSTVEYTYNATTHDWEYSTGAITLGDKLFIKDYLTSLNTIQNVDKTYKFYARDDSYRIFASSTYDGGKMELTMIFAGNGLMTERYGSDINTTTLDKNEYRETLTYSK